MFFPERTRSIGDTDRVLDVGPGAMPHPRAHVYLEKRFADEAEASGQRGHAPPAADPARTVYYDGGSFPFHDKEFDYVICSHVLEHVLDVEQFVRELTRVAHRGYLEFPTIYYDYIYDFPEHAMLLFHRDGVVRWMPKSESLLPAYKPVTRLFYESLRQGHVALIDALRDYLFQGFEWFDRIEVQRATGIDELTYAASEIEVPAYRPPAFGRPSIRSLLGRVRWKLRT